MDIQTLPKEFLKPRQGVYFLFKDETIVYIGQSLNVVGRILDHARHHSLRYTRNIELKEFDNAKFIELPEDVYSKNLRHFIEAIFIRYYKPILNSTKTKYHTDEDDEFLKQIGIEYPFELQTIS